MSAFRITTIFIVAPFIGALVFLFFLILGQHFFDFEEEIEISVFGLFAFNYIVSETHFRLLCGFFSVIFFFWTVVRDYSSFFPKVLEMTVRFEEAELEKILGQISSDPRFNFDIYSDWRARRRQYLKEIECLVKEKTGKDFAFGGTASSIGKGTTTFYVQRTGNALQAYRVIGAKGSIDIFDQASSIEFKSEFDLMDTESSSIEVSIWEMIFRRDFLLKPFFTQTYRIDPTTRVSHGFLASVTAVKFFPFIRIGKSVYLLKGEKRYTPIAYCSYEY